MYVAKKQNVNSKFFQSKYHMDSWPRHHITVFEHFTTPNLAQTRENTAVWFRSAFAKTKILTTSTAARFVPADPMYKLFCAFGQMTLWVSADLVKSVGVKTIDLGDSPRDMLSDS